MTFPGGGLRNFLDLDKVEQQAIIKKLKDDTPQHYNRMARWGVRVWLAAKAGVYIPSGAAYYWDKIKPLGRVSRTLTREKIFDLMPARPKFVKLKFIIHIPKHNSHPATPQAPLQTNPTFLFHDLTTSSFLPIDAFLPPPNAYRWYQP